MEENNVTIKDNEFFHPPFVVNDFNPAISLTQTVDWGLNKLGMPSIHESGITGKGIKIAILDTRVKADHPDLKGAVVKSLNATAEPDTVSYGGHGIACAGIAGGRNNSTGVLGYAPECDIVAIKVMAESGSGNLADIVKGIDMAIAEGCHIISMSLGTSSDVSSLRLAVKRATDKGIFVVAAAGNDGQVDSVNYPGKYENVIAVAATNQAGDVSAFSSMGWDVDIAAPGERILCCWKNNGYVTISGTSMATPAIAGILACLLQAKLEVTQQKLYDTAIDIGDVGKDIKSGYGLISPSGYIAKYTPPPPPPPPVEPIDPNLKVRAAKLKAEEVVVILEDFLNPKV